MKRPTLVAALLVVAALARPAAADTDPKRMFEQATAEFNLGHYEKAAGMYEDIYKVTLEPLMLYNIAQAHRLGGNFEKAVFFYKGYLRAQPQAKNRGEVQKRIGELEDAIAARRRSQERPPNTTANVEPHARVATSNPEQPRATPTPTPEPTPTPAPEPSTTQPAPEAQPTTQAAPATAANETPAEKPVWKKWWFWTIIGGVVVAGVVVGVAVAATQPAPKFNPNLPDTGPGAAMTARPAPLVEVRF